MRTADAKTDGAGYSIGGADSVYLTNQTGYETYSNKVKKGAVRHGDNMLERRTMSLQDLNDIDGIMNLPDDAHMVAGFLIGRGHNIRSQVEVEIYQRYTIDTKTGERKPSVRGKRTVIYHAGERYQSISGHVFVGDGHIEKYRTNTDEQ